MAIWCPKREQRREVEICQKLCKDWSDRLVMEGEGLACRFEKKEKRVLRKRRERKEANGE